MSGFSPPTVIWTVWPLSQRMRVAIGPPLARITSSSSRGENKVANGSSAMESS